MMEALESRLEKGARRKCGPAIQMWKCGCMKLWSLLTAKLSFLKAL